jgi:hypothetical protein
MALIQVCFISLMGLMLLGCQSHPCRDIKNQRIQESANGSNGLNQSRTPTAGVKTLKVKVFKADGSLQCAMGKKISLDEMQKELKGIEVFSKTNQNDGLMRIQVCGAPTGDSNVFEIKQEDLEKALKLGFKQWTLN